jgi:hypothetical protein
MSRIRLTYNGLSRADLKACGETAAALEQFERPSDKVSDNRHGRQADASGHPRTACPRQASRDAGSPRL